MGANAARNRGIREAMSPIVAFLDSDDAFRPEKLSTVVALFDRHPDLGTLVDSYEIVKPTSGRNAQPLINRRIADNEAFLKALFTSTVRNRRLRKATSGITVRRDVAFKAGLFDEEVQRRQDMEFLARLAKTAPCQTTDRLLWTKYEQPQSISFTGAGFIASTLLISRIHPEYAASPSSMAADVVIYLAESLSRRRFGQVAADIRDLVKEFGLPATLALLGEGAWAWYRDPRKITLPEESA
jgi:glycosyltransferase involved in cell wall biosynthesis